MHSFTIALADRQDCTADAEYYVVEDGFVTFKGDGHKQVASFAAALVVSVVRSETAALGWRERRQNF